MDLQKLVLEQAVLIEQLRVRIVELEAEVVALKNELALAKKNSSNSSKPPSSDIVKPPKNQVQKQGKRKRGGQKGHKQNLRKLFDASQVDKIVELQLDVCPTCGGKLVRSHEQAKIHQQVELVERPFLVTEFQQTQYWCEHCQCFHCAHLPPDVKNAGFFGSKLIALTAYLKGRAHASYKTLQDFFADVLKLKVSTGFLAKQIRKVTNAIASPYNELLDRLPNEKHLHIDETGGKENGQKRWTWCLRSPQFTVFHVDASRGSVVLTNLLGENFNGIISCDFWGAYRKFARLTSTQLQFCWAHLIREIKFLAENTDKNAANFGKRLLKNTRDMFATIHQRDEFSMQTWKRQMNKHRQKILKTSQKCVPNNNDAKNISSRLHTWQDEYFRFIEHGLPPTNNLGEQTIRKVVIDRKVTQGTRSDWGNRWLERFWSVLSTCQQQGRNLMAFLNACVAASLNKQNSPNLINN